MCPGGADHYLFAHPLSLMLVKMATLGHVEEFDASQTASWESYAKRLSYYLEANKVENPAQKCAILLTVCHLLPCRDFIFFKWDQKANEGIADYLAELCHLAEFDLTLATEQEKALAAEVASHNVREIHQVFSSNVHLLQKDQESDHHQQIQQIIPSPTAPCKPINP
ncbi:hypothetical protein Y1Q_0001651 [Alligator mississippiensis]|uniref:Uncharacterized protein n=1 Tax=Alligator mississippiensis TaxID=8496 RepID=A0A151MA93_ALLMI|nr:hypothetical protein Y1Q_0001651 [Alligator mississippiensis]